jgi:hypothetical protein
MNRYKTVPGLSSQQKATSNTTCQKCLKKDRTSLTIFVLFSAWLTSLYAITATSARRPLKSVHMSHGLQERSNYSIPNLRPNYQVMYLMIFYGSMWPQLILFKMCLFVLLFARLDLTNWLGMGLLMSSWPRRMKKGDAQWRDNLPVPNIHLPNHGKGPVQSQPVPQTPFQPSQPIFRSHRSDQGVAEMSQ